MSEIAKITSLDQLHIFEKSGTIAALQHWVETNTTVTTTGGSGTVVNGNGNISGPSTTTHTSSTEMVRMFVREDGGTEFDVSLPDLGFGVREGHRVSFIYAGDQASRRGYPVAVVNHTTRKSEVLKSRVSWICHDALGCAWFGLTFFGAMVLSVSLAEALIYAIHPLNALLAGVVGTLTWVGGPIVAITALASFNKKRKRLHQAILTRLEQEVKRSMATAQSAASN